MPDHVRETFEPESEVGGEDGPDGRALRYLDWAWDGIQPTTCMRSRMRLS